MEFSGKTWHDTDLKIREILEKRLESGNDDAFFVFNIKDVEAKFKFWNEKFPRVKPFYAMKANPTDFAIKTLAKLGTGFDCASRKEIERILDFGVSPERIIYANPAKQPSYLRFAQQKGVDKMTFDNVDELLKIKEIFPAAKLVLRIRFDAKSAMLLLGKKFGCDPGDEAKQLIRQCQDMQLNLIGICFHGGSNLHEPEVYYPAIAACKKLFDFATSIGLKLNFLDIGGGFSGVDAHQVESCAKQVTRALDEFFPDDQTEIIAEPGAFFSNSAMKHIVHVNSRRVTRSPDGQILNIEYFINEGLFTSFMQCYMYNSALIPRPLVAPKFDASKTYDSTFWGQSCNSIDKVFEIKFSELHVGDWIIFDDCGSYGFCHATSFNGFPIPDVLLLEP